MGVSSEKQTKRRQEGGKLKERNQRKNLKFVRKGSNKLAKNSDRRRGMSTREKVEVLSNSLATTGYRESPRKLSDL